MGRPRSLEVLKQRLDALSEGAVSLRFAAVEACPGDPPSRFVDELQDDVESVMGWVREAALAVEAARRAARAADALRLRTALATAHERLLRVLDVHGSRLHAAEPVMKLLEVGRHHGGSWASWSRGAHGEIGKLLEPLVDTLRALADVWEDFTERLAESGRGLAFMAAEAGDETPAALREGADEPGPRSH